jgi:RimJ/RimL family protein N-acetyltransferase
MEGPVLRTRRLVLEPFSSGQVDGLLTLFRTPEVRRFLLDDQVVDRGWVISEVATSQALFETHGIGLWALRKREDEEPEEERILGAVGYRFFHQPPELQLVVALLPRWWGRGLATEACREVIRYGYQAAGLERIAADTDAGNDPSIRLMARLGLRFEGRVEKGGVDTLCYALEFEGGGGAFHVE